MSNDFADDKVKIRFKFRSGDEFEAEGSPQFIEKQRADFLQLISQERNTRTRRPAAAASPSPAPAEYLRTTPLGNIPDDAPAQAPFPTEAGEQAQNIPPSMHSVEPALYRRPTPSLEKPGWTGSTKEHPIPTISQGISAAERAALHSTHAGGGINSAAPALSPDVRLWEEIVRVEEQMVFLRRKNRLLTPELAAIVLLAAARVLLRLPDGYSALALSKSLKKSGYGGERLDRVLGGEMKIGTVRSVGSKRSRLYFLSDEGFAKAYVLAEKLADPSHV